VRNFARLFDTNDLSQLLAGVRVACIGDVTSQTAAEYGLRVDVQPAEFTAPALARAVAEHFAGEPRAHA
jgi:uroporphyrinogen III methyltransferase/synthase